jgi:hypothetical protein
MKEERITSDTGGQKSVKDARFDLIPSPFLWGLSKVFGFGSKKYDDDNYRKGYSWKLSYGALQRHLHAFWMGEDYDKESGLHHLLHGAWHCCALFIFSTNPSKYSRFDDRPDKPDVPNLDPSFKVPLPRTHPTILCAPSTPATNTGPAPIPIGDKEITRKVFLKTSTREHRVDFIDNTRGYIDGAYYNGTSFTSKVRLYESGYETVDEEIEALGKMAREGVGEVSRLERDVAASKVE